MKTSYNIHGLARIFRPWEFRKYNFWPVTFFAVWIYSSTLLCIVVVSASGKGVCHHIRWSWPRLFFRFRSWKSMLDPCTWGLPHHWGWPNLGQRVSLGHLGFRAGKEEANFWTCLNTLSFLVRSWKKVFFLQRLTFEHGTLLCIVVVFLLQGRGSVIISGEVGRDSSFALGLGKAC